MDQDPQEIERQIDETVLTIAKLFGNIEFTAEEQRFIEDGGRRLVELGFETLVQSPQVMQLRPFVVLFAMAATLGNHQIFSDGIPAMRKLKRTAPAECWIARRSG